MERDRQHDFDFEIGSWNREIAGALYLSEGTVKNHVSNNLSKLGVRDRTRAVRKNTLRVTSQKPEYWYPMIHAIRCCYGIRPFES